jgi:CheY-like chemotaxis protein
MDIEMPVMDGLTCARRIRELQHSGEILGHIPILAVSANARSEQVRQALDAGMDDAIAKPFRIPELVPKLELLARKE